MHKVLYVPLDDRPCNYHYPLLLSRITEDVELTAPPFSLMGKCKQAADTDAIWDWLFREAGEADYAILSVDTLVYGNIIHSRIHQRTAAQIDGYLDRFRRLHARFPHLEIEAFNLVTRVSSYNSSFEDPDYWEACGHSLWRRGWLEDRIRRHMADEKEQAEYGALERDIPGPILADFLDRRRKNLHVNLQCVDFVHDGVFRHLTVPKDDTALYGYAAMDQKALAGRVREKQVMDRVMIYPGADEVGAVLLARVFNRIHDWEPRIYTRCSSLLGPCIVPRYEDRPLGESLKAQITSLGGVVVDTAAESDFLLAVHTPGTDMEECCSQADKALSYSTHTNLPEFFRYIQYYIRAYDKPVALSDVAFANGSDIEMMQHAGLCGILERIAAYGGWNTAENTNGMCLAHGCIHTYYAQRGFSPAKALLSQEFLVRKIVEDYLFQALLVPDAADEVEKRYPGRSPYHCGEIEGEMADYAGGRLRETIGQVFGGTFKGRRIRIDSFYLPWDRIHELGFTLRLQ